MDIRYFSDKVVEWYLANKRDLPWRHTTDPYKVWLSEIILQQTRVNQGMPYYLRFLEAFPTVLDLANATEEAVLRLWQGLGYYTRARNLHKCAKIVVSSYNARFPTDYQTLMTLPGIGEYTAAAIASFSSRQAVAVVDGNVSRVLSRIFGIEQEINSTEGKKVFSKLANELISRKSPDVHNQGLMEFGAMHCLPRNPHCNTCHFEQNCFAAKHSLQLDFPRKNKAAKARKRYFTYLVIQKGKSLLMQKRETKDIWFGLYDFHLMEHQRPMSAANILNAISEQLGKSLQPLNVRISGSYKHILTHQHIQAKFVIIKVRNFVAPKDKNLKFYTFDKIYDLPKPVLINRFLSDYKNFCS
jgi:A/G-specific adenine glycosylase